jgi:hypothetical protein
MTGRILAKPWEGQRNEAFAEYVLSSIATVVRVPRQADFGFDLLCTLTHYFDKVLYAGRSFGVQVKPHSEKRLTYGGLSKKNGQLEWKGHQIDWLFEQDQPLFIGLVDLKKHTLSLYSTHRMWWVYNDIGKPGQIVLVPDTQPTGGIGPSWFKRKKLPTLDGGREASNDFSYEVPLGEPVVRIDLKRLESKDQQFRSEIEESIKDAVDLNYRNIMNCHGNIPITEERKIWMSDNWKDSFFYHLMNDERKKSLLRSISPAITSLLNNYASEATEDMETIINMAKLLKKHRFLRLEGILLLEKIECLVSAKH